MAMQKYRGIIGEVWNGTTKLAMLKDCKISDKASTTDVTDHDSGGYGAKMPTMKEVTITANLWYGADSITFAEDASHAALTAAYIANTILTLNIRLQGTGTGKPNTAYSVYVDSISTDMQTNSAIPFDVSFVGAGAAPVVSAQA